MKYITLLKIISLPQAPEDPAIMLNKKIRSFVQCFAERCADCKTAYSTEAPHWRGLADSFATFFFCKKIKIQIVQAGAV
ncbi:hypothetical protein [Erwinia endophytica]|uniref:hypothetical protein n=1 Tax=Erwinia endophytica TaxID=1563158 RepID=UPI001265DAEA|nr:hypothetical protein [Erwinia endophytica]